MSAYNRTITIAVDDLTGEVIKIEKLLNKTKEGFVIRKEEKSGEAKYSCYECGQELITSGSKFDRVHFKHKPGHINCILSSNEYSKSEFSLVQDILVTKESPRHIELKNKIGSLLETVDGVSKNSIAIDNKFIIRGKEKRRPDVYCKYNGKEIVFEIQLSKLSLKYIMGRYNFYKKHGIFLIWILDDFNIRDQGTLERDIKYLTKYENFFKLDESSDTFKLICDYKKPYISTNETHSKWHTRSCSLAELKFDMNDKQIYFFNLKLAIEETKDIIKERRREKRKEEKAQEKLKAIEIAEKKASLIIEEIKNNKEKGYKDFTTVTHNLMLLNKFENDYLNKKLNFFIKKPLARWIRETTSDNVRFLEFILQCEYIDQDITTTDNDISLLQLILKNKDLKHYSEPQKALFRRGYKLSINDTSYIKENLNEREVLRLTYLNNLKDRDLVNLVYLNSTVISIIETARLKKIVGFNYPKNGWIAFANNAVNSHTKYWDHIERAFRRYDFYDFLIEKDKKGTFKKKVNAIKSEDIDDDNDFHLIIIDLFPELI